MVISENNRDKVRLYKELYPMIKKEREELSTRQFEQKYYQIREDWRNSDFDDKELQLKFDVIVTIFEELLAPKSVKVGKRKKY